jgi:hypothetical protein
MNDFDDDFPPNPADFADLYYESRDKLVRRSDTLVRLAEAVDETENDEARNNLLDCMSLILRSIAAPIRQSELVEIPGGKKGGKAN